MFVCDGTKKNNMQLGRGLLQFLSFVKSEDNPTSDSWYTVNQNLPCIYVT